MVGVAASGDPNKSCAPHGGCCWCRLPFDGFAVQLISCKGMCGSLAAHVKGCASDGSVKADAITLDNAAVADRSNQGGQKPP